MRERRMEEINLRDIVGDGEYEIEKALKHRNKAKAYLILVALKRSDKQSVRDTELAKLMKIDYTYAYQILRWFEDAGMSRRIPPKKPRRFILAQSLENDAWIKIAKATLGMETVEEP